MNERTVVDVIVLLDGKNGGFHSYMDYNDALELQACGGLSQVDKLHLVETADRKVPESYKQGLIAATDLLVKLEPNVTYYVN